MYNYNHQQLHYHPFPCFHCHPHSYIRMVQNLIERCLLHRMDRDQCVHALAEHARIRPLITLAVWKELHKENKDFFRSYFQSIYPRSYTNVCKGHQDFHEEATGDKSEEGKQSVKLHL